MLKARGRDRGKVLLLEGGGLGKTGVWRYMDEFVMDSLDETVHSVGLLMFPMFFDDCKNCR